MAIKILNVVGARPNFMKVAPLMREYARFPDRIEAALLHTGQHYDEAMSSVFFAQLGLREPDFYLGVGSGSHAQQTGRIMIAFEEAVLKHRPDLIVVVGDVNSTMACALVGAKLQIPVAHVEAGLRSNDRSMPEEINRLVTDSIADFLFTTSEDAIGNLLREGISESKIFFVGNTMIDTLLALRDQLREADMRRELDIGSGAFGFVTLHRPSNVDDVSVLRGICQAFATIQERLMLVWPLHPRTKKMLESTHLIQYLSTFRNIRITEPMSYLDSMSLMSSARLVLTDSGGVQEETTALGIPCLTLRMNTERPVTVTEGTNELIGNDPQVITEKTLSLLNGKVAPRRSPKLWDGKASHRIVEILLGKLA